MKTPSLLKWPDKTIRALTGWLNNEITQRANMIGGVDNLFLLVSEVAPDFNPVRACRRIAADGDDLLTLMTGLRCYIYF